MILFATDLDRTLLPNGPAPDDKNTAELFRELEKVPHLLVYVTGRNLDMVREAEEKYSIPTPDYLIAEVGTAMFKKQNMALVPETRWNEYITAHEQKWNREKIEESIGTKHELVLQEEWKQNHFKISYYLPSTASKKDALEHIGNVLADIGIHANVLWSVDPLADNVGLIDILPKTATKATALEFLREQEHLSKKDVVYCGDSGNDIQPLTNGYRSILVNDAPEDVKETVSNIVAKNGNSDTLYIAHKTKNLNGNYASGILEGLIHFGIVPGTEAE